MNVEFAEKFYKDLNGLKSKELRNRIADIIDECRNAVSLVEIRNLKKLSGYKFYYRVRVGDYRIGIEVNEAMVKFLRVAHRKDIYRIFP
jgi:mRNA interferase RelE/StbE